MNRGLATLSQHLAFGYSLSSKYALHERDQKGTKLSRKNVGANNPSFLINSMKRFEHAEMTQKIHREFWKTP